MRVSKTVKLDKFAIVVTRMCQLYLGLNDKITWCKRTNENICERLLQNIMSYGNFGTKHGEGNKVETVTTRIRHEGTFHFLQANGERKWELYHRHNWLKPFCWIYMICRLISKGIRSGRKQNVLNDIKMSNERYELLKQLEVV